eukprot:scaffold1836_cov97-Cylindrotheca_fusiformis.AAC.2
MLTFSSSFAFLLLLVISSSIAILLLLAITGVAESQASSLRQGAGGKKSLGSLGLSKPETNTGKLVISGVTESQASSLRQGAGGKSFDSLGLTKPETNAGKLFTSGVVESQASSLRQGAGGKNLGSLQPEPNAGKLVISGVAESQASSLRQGAGGKNLGSLQPEPNSGKLVISGVAESQASSLRQGTGGKNLGSLGLTKPETNAGKQPSSQETSPTARKSDDFELATFNRRLPTAGTSGDPHFKTWKGEHFEYHGQCDMILAKDDTFADGLGLDMQIRTKLVRYWSYIHRAAVRIGDDILEVEGTADDILSAENNHYWINFEYQGELKTIGGFPIKYQLQDANQVKRWFEIDLSSKYPGQRIVISTFKEFVRMDYQNGSAESVGNAVGMLGNFHTGKTLARDGATELHDFSVYGNEWQVLPHDAMLFHDVSAPQFPKKCMAPEDPQGERRRRLDESSIMEEEAEAACASLPDPMDRKDCVYDIIATQDMGMIGAY